MKINAVGKNTDALPAEMQKIPGVKFVVEWLADGISAKVFGFSLHQHIDMLDMTTRQNRDQFYGAGVACSAFDPIKIQFNSPSCFKDPVLATDQPPAGAEQTIADDLRASLTAWLAANLPSAPAQQTSPTP